MSDFIIDQNVIYDAWRGKNLDNAPAISERHFMYSFLNSEHKLAINATILQKFTRMEKEKISDSQYVDNLIVPMFVKTLFDSKRTRHVDDRPVEFNGGKKCDKHFVSVTLQTNGIFVTNDGKLRSAIQSDTVVSHCICVQINEAISRL